MYRLSWIIVCVFLISISFTKLVSQVLDEESWMLYDDSEVAVINIYLDPDILEWIMDPSNSYSDVLNPATVHFKNALIDETIDSVGFRLRGNTSRDAQKKSFKLSFNTFVPGRQFYNVEKINLNGEHNDPSIIRSKLCWDLFNKIGLTASRAAHAVLYINGDYYGLYISIEHIDEEFLENHFADPSGNLWKCLYPADLTYRGESPNSYYPYFDSTRPYELKTNTDAYDYSELARLIDIINNTPDALFADSLESILNVSEVLKYLVVNVLVGSWDDYWALMNNYYLYYEPSNDIFHWIPYDYDNTFGISWFETDWVSVDPYEFGRVDYGPRPLATRIFENDRYNNLYTHFMKFYRDQVFLLSRWESRLDSLREMITPWVKIDTFSTKDYGFQFDDFLRSYTNEEYSNQHVKNGLKQFVNLRNNYLLAQLKWVDSGPSIYALDWYPKNPGPEDSIHVVASAFSHTALQNVKIEFKPGLLTVIEEYPMVFKPVANTTLVEGTDRWVGIIPPLGEDGFGHFKISALDDNGNSNFYPAHKEIYFEVPTKIGSGLVINEFMARNSTAYADQSGEFDDWLEIYNPTSQTFDLSNLYLTDNRQLPNRWRLPQEQYLLEPGQFVIVWCDGDTTQDGFHTNFRLDGDGEFIGLVDTDGITFIDSISFEEQTEDLSFGRYPDGEANWVIMNPTPKQNNSPTGIRDEFVPQDFLLRIYPNPFNPKTIISYQLTENSHVELSIFNLMGQKVANLVSARQPAGSHKVEWIANTKSGTSLGSGLYFCYLKAGRREIIQKMVLIK